MEAEEVRKFLNPLSNGNSWTARCIARLKHGDPIRVARGLVGKGGLQPPELVRSKWDAWGIDLQTCYEFCGRDVFPMV